MAWDRYGCLRGFPERPFQGIIVRLPGGSISRQAVVQFGPRGIQGGATKMLWCITTLPMPWLNVAITGGLREYRIAMLDPAR
jgi:hypothetical protein